MIINGKDIINFIVNNKLENSELSEIYKIIKNKNIAEKKKQNRELNKHERYKDHKGKNKIILLNEYAEVVVCDKNINEEKRILIDLDDVEKVSHYTWNINKRKHYATAKIKHKITSMHRYILDYTGNLEVDHINRNKLDNRKNNLRIVTRSVNLANNNAIGVYKVRNKWLSTVTRNGIHYRLGLFNSFEEAKEARNNKIKELETK